MNRHLKNQENHNVLKRLRRKIRNRTERAIADFHMIEPGDRILIGVSGGADSLSLLQIFTEGFPHTTREFTFIAVHLDPGFDGTDKSKALEKYFQSLHIDYLVEKTDIAAHALDPDAKKNPCFICSLHRRRRIYEIAHQRGYNKIAYGHHKDDIVETLLLNILYGRKIESMNPVQEVFQGNLHIIRPFTYLDEHLLKQFAREMALPVFPKYCPMDGKTRRETVKQLILDLQSLEKNANIKENIYKSLKHVNFGFNKGR